MEIKSVHPVNFMYFRTDTTVSELYKYLPVGQELFREAVSNNLPITGPIHWHYFGFEGDESKSFQLEIALPVGEIPDGYDGKYHFKRTEAFKCVSIRHEGNWLDIPKSYGKAFEFISKNNLKPNAINREVYINADFKNAEANSTELQIGVE